MKVIQINCVYARGSTGKITRDLHEGLLEKGVDSIVIYGRGQKSSDPRVIKVCSEFYAHVNKVWSFITGLMYGGCFLSTNRIIGIIKKEKPDIVHLQCINGNFVNIYRLVTWLKKHSIKTVLTLHAEFMHTANCGYALDCEKWKSGCGHCPRLKQETHSWFLDGTHRSWVKMKKAFEGFDNLQLVSCSNWLRERSNQSPIFNNRPNITIYNGIRTELFDCKIQPSDIDVLLKYGIPQGKKIILHVTPNFFGEVKGGKYFRELSELLPDEYQCVVVGCANSDAHKILHIPYTNNQGELAALYRCASVFVITSKCDNYPTVCLEANCCGTPVVGFDVGGVKETIFPGMGDVVPFGNIALLKEEIKGYAGGKVDDEIIHDAIKRNGMDRMNNDYYALYTFLNDRRK